jgi:predicted RNase H-like nuclease (RuvC/YqgF family)
MINYHELKDDSFKKLETKLEKKHREDIEQFQEKTNNLGNEIGKLRQEISELREYLATKESGRMDFNYLSVILKKELHKRGKMMDYKAISDFFHFRSAPEAYRLMNKTAKLFPFDVEIRYINNSKKKKKVIIAMK